jgi:hypothetical protein
MTRRNITNEQAEWLEASLRHSHMTKAELARQVAGILGIDYDRKRLSKLGKELQKLRYEEISAISAVTGFSAPPLGVKVENRHKRPEPPPGLMFVVLEETLLQVGINAAAAAEIAEAVELHAANLRVTRGTPEDAIRRIIRLEVPEILGRKS